VAPRLITTDCHIAPPFSLVDKLPVKYRGYFPRLVPRDGATLEIHRPQAVTALMGSMDGSRNLPVQVIEDNPQAIAQAAVCNVLPEARPSFDAAEQVADLERDGVYGGVLIGRFEDYDAGIPPEAEIAYCQVVNDWLAETWEPYLDRFAPGICIPWRDVAASVKEVRRAAAMGLRPALLPESIFFRPYFSPEWEPLWEVCNELKVPLTLHVGGLQVDPALTATAARHPGQGDTGWYALCVRMGEVLGWFVYSGVFERYPDLHVVMTEGYAGWLAFAMQFFDHHWIEGPNPTTTSRLHQLERTASGRDMLQTGARLAAPPSYYLKRQAHATFMWDPVAIEQRHRTGIDCLMWGNDYPHMEGSYPNSVKWVEKQFAGVPDAEVDAMVRGNAAKIFGLTGV
jgi:predicted TIM-barrel fold metal-dependent hydrolase